MPVSGVKIDRHDLRSTHEEADILIIQHAISSSLSGKSVRVVCDDTDVFILLVHFYNSKCKGSNYAPMVMSSPVKQRAVIDIRATADAHSDIADDLPAIHGLSGADTIASLHGIGRATVCSKFICRVVSQSLKLVMWKLICSLLKLNPLNSYVLHMAR